MEEQKGATNIDPSDASIFVTPLFQMGLYIRHSLFADGSIFVTNCCQMGLYIRHSLVSDGSIFVTNCFQMGLYIRHSLVSDGSIFVTPFVSSFLSQMGLYSSQTVFRWVYLYIRHSLVSDVSIFVTPFVSSFFFQMRLYSSLPCFRWVYIRDSRRAEQRAATEKPPLKSRNAWSDAHQGMCSTKYTLYTCTHNCRVL